MCAIWGSIIHKQMHIFKSVFYILVAIVTSTFIVMFYFNQSLYSLYCTGMVWYVTYTYKSCVYMLCTFSCTFLP